MGDGDDSPITVTERDDTTDVTLYYGNAPRGSSLPHIILRPVSDVPRHLQSQQGPLSFSTWDFQIWAKSATQVGEIYEKLLDIINCDDITDGWIGMLRGRGLPLMSEENRPNEIIYSRVVECEIITDTALPTVDITFNVGMGQTEATFQWSKSVSGFDDDDITLSEGTKGTFTGDDGDTTYTLDITSPSSGLTVTVKADAVTLGNCAYSQSFPTVKITFDPTSLGNGEETTATFQWSKSVSDFLIDDITLSEGTKGTFTGDDGDTTYTLDITSPSSGSGEIMVTVARVGNVEHSQSISYSDS